MASRGAINQTEAPAPLPQEAWEDGALTPAQAASFLSVSTRTVFKMMKTGLLRWGRLGSARRIPRLDCVALLRGKADPDSLR